MIGNRTFGGSGIERAYQVRRNSSYSLFIAGFTGSFGGGQEDAWFIRTDSSGNEIGNNTYGGSGNDRFTAFKKTDVGEYIVFTGSTTSYGNGGSEDVWLVKTNYAGIEIWNRTYGGALNDSARAISETIDGGYIIAGMTESYGNGGRDLWLIKTDVNGNETWNKTFGGSQNDSASSLNLTEGGYIIAGETFSYGTGGDMWLIKTNMTGYEFWNKTFGGPGYEHAESFKQYGNGYLIVGAVENGPASDALIVKTDSNGNQTSQKTIGGSGFDTVFDIQSKPDNSFILAGSTDSFGLTNRDTWLIFISGGS